jgi:hypothetical protein
MAESIPVFDCYLLAPAGTLARGHYAQSAVRQLHPRKNNIQLRDSGRFRVRVGCQVCSRKNHQETLARSRWGGLAKRYPPFTTKRRKGGGLRLRLPRPTRWIKNNPSENRRFFGQLGHDAGRIWPAGCGRALQAAANNSSKHLILL